MKLTGCYNGGEAPMFKRRWQRLLLAAIIIAALGFFYVRTHPLVFNESMWGHAHCIKIGGLALSSYAAGHSGNFPYHPKGYGNALLLVDDYAYFALTGPGYDDAAFHDAKRLGRELSEEECGRVYIQGLTTKSNREIVLLFDKLATPGGDHCASPARLWQPLGREIWTVGGMHQFIVETDWPAFAQRQVELLVAEGWQREEAERLLFPQGGQKSMPP